MIDHVIGVSVADIPSKIALESIIAFLPAHVYWKNTQGVYLGCNDKQAKSLGFISGKEIIGKTDFELPWPEGAAEEFRNNDLKVINTGKPISAEETTLIGKKISCTN